MRPPGNDLYNSSGDYDEHASGGSPYREGDGWTILWINYFMMTSTGTGGNGSESPALDSPARKHSGPLVPAELATTYQHDATEGATIATLHWALTQTAALPAAGQKTRL